jgi:hypothetical protein
MRIEMLLSPGNGKVSRLKYNKWRYGQENEEAVKKRHMVKPANDII